MLQFLQEGFLEHTGTIEGEKVARCHIHDTVRPAWLVCHEPISLAGNIHRLLESAVEGGSIFHGWCTQDLLLQGILEHCFVIHCGHADGFGEF